ncbi:hypothetical protein GCM10023189_14070 [Nibrella saemangeumensis]|uniref:Lipocalin-like domain-containing protein n=1 Tax=Nibrella saemangeumensis TaxID=1084526 RepID=A0ABP8MN70_9BACT
MKLYTTPLHTIRSMQKSLLALVITFVVCSSLALAQDKPSVNGTWKLNQAKSKFTGGGPDNITIVLNQQGQALTEQLTVGTPNGDEKMDMKYTLDGQESTNSMGPNQIKSTANWNGNDLVINWSMGDAGYFNRKINVSEDGKVMTIVVSRKMQGPEETETVVLDKQ